MATTIFLTDAEATPVSRGFAPARSGPDFRTYEYRDGGVYAGYDKLTMRIVRPTGQPRSGQNRNIKLHTKLELPLLKTVSGSTGAGFTPAPEVAYRVVFEGIWTFPEQSSLQDRQNLRVMVNDLIGNETPTHNAVDKYEIE